MNEEDVGLQYALQTVIIAFGNMYTQGPVYTTN